MERNGIGKYENYITLGALIVVMGALPLLLSNSYHLSIMAFIGINTMLAVGLCLLMGYAGQVSLGHAAFYGIGAYTSGILTTTFKMNPWLAIGVAAVFTGVVAYVIGVPMFRLKGNNLAMGTLGFGIIVYIIFVEMRDWTGGPSGLTGIPSLSIFGFTFDNDLKYYYLIWAIALLFLVLSLNIVNSRVGRALRSIHGSEIAAETLGVNTNKYKIQILVVAAMYASVAGSLYAHYLTFINPQPFSFKLSIEIVVMVVIGGLSSVWGALLGAATTTVLSEVLRGVIPQFLKGATGEYEIVVFGIILMVVMIFLPEGLFSGSVRIVKSWRREKESKQRTVDETAIVEPSSVVAEGHLAVEDK